MKNIFQIPLLTLLVFVFSLDRSYAQAGIDSLKIMNYNLTNYGNNFGGCTSANNGLTLKNPEFKTIVKYVNPDILGACEVNVNPAIANNFLANVLNTDGVTYYKKSNFQAEGFSDITSVLYFNSNKLTLAGQSFVNTSPRYVHHYRLYVNAESLALGDTIWINILATHLKAGAGTSDQTERANAAKSVRTYLNNFPKTENCLIMGDFNVYRNTEAAYQNLTETGTRPTYQFLDPINRVGSWGSNSSYADVHTQCPIRSGNSCFSGGGLDDRFDFILMNRHMLNDSAGLKYKPGTYKAIGNDGRHFDRAINESPTNNSVPANVLLSLTKASDHLPVVATLQVAGTIITSAKAQVYAHSILSFFDGNDLKFTGLDGNNLEKILVFNMNGQQVFSGKPIGNNEVSTASLSRLNAGIYNIKIIYKDGKVLFSRVSKRAE